MQRKQIRAKGKPKQLFHICIIVLFHHSQMTRKYHNDWFIYNKTKIEL